VLRRWAVLGAVLAVCGWLAGEEPESPAIRFSAPDEGSYVVGETEIRFEIMETETEIDRIDLYVAGRLVGTALPPNWSLVWDAPSGVSGEDLVAVAFAGDRLVAKARRATYEAAYGDEIQVSVVQLYPVVVDRRGRYVRNLRKGDFTILDQGSPVEIESFATEALALSIAVVLDVSESMFDRLGLVQDASCGFVDELGDGDRVAVYEFNHGVREVVAFTGERDAVKEGIRSLRAVGGTALYDAVCSVLNEIRTVPGRKAVFLFSDGRDERSVTTLQHAIRAARQAEAIIYTVGTGDDLESLKARDDLRQLAEETGGEAHFIDRLKDLPEVFDDVLSHLRAQYVLSYPPPPGPPGVRSLEVRVSNKKYSVQCRKSYEHDP
jgi:VWFA-related protein